MLTIAVLAALLQGTPAAVPQTAQAQDTTRAYADPGTRALVAAARERRSRVERSIDLYRVTARQRAYAGMEALTRNRTLYGGEMAVRIEWRRDQQGTVRVLGAREVSPATDRRSQVPDDLQQEVTGLAFDPDALQLDLFTFGARVERTTDEDTSRVEVDATPIDPLSEGSEAHYRFRAADTTTIRLPDGARLRMVELEIIPRRREFRLLRGTLWIDLETHGVVRSVLTTARPFDLRRDVDEDIPAVVNVAGPIRAEVRYVTIEYALAQGKYWLPRLIAIDAEANVGVLAGFPVRYERSYSDYEVEASANPGRTAVADLARPDSIAQNQCRADAKNVGGVCDCTSAACRIWQVEVPTDTLALLTSPELPEPLVEGGGKLITGEEVESLARVLTPSFGGFGPQVETNLANLRMLRYNRVEALSVGARADVTWGPLVIDGEARIGLADREPNVELGVARQTMFWRTRLAGYRRLTPFDPTSRALGLGNSLSSLLLGRDEADYFLASGVELTGAPLRTGRWSYDWRLFGEHQHPMNKNTDVSLAAVWEGDDVFRENRAAQRADQLGAGLTLRRDFGTDRTPVRFSLATGLEGQTGDFRFGRASATARLAAPLGGAVALALEGSAGTTTGDVPLQGQWYLGGPHTVRGYEGALLGGTAFWRGRAEIATPTPAARLVLFGDAGWVGSRDAWESDPNLLSAGVGASFLDGLIRLDVSRALRSPTGWRLDLYLDAAL